MLCLVMFADFFPNFLTRWRQASRFVNIQIRLECDAVSVSWSTDFVLPCHTVAVVVTVCLFSLGFAFAA